MARRPVLTFDTSGINRLADDADSAPLLAGLKSGFYVRVTFTSISEIVATSSGERRRKLLDVCRKLLYCGDCIGPQDDLLTRLIHRFEEAPASFDWATVPFTLPEAEAEIARQESFPDDLSTEEREFARANENIFVKIYDDAKPHFDALFAEGKATKPRSVAELVTILQSGGAFWTLAAGLYSRVARKPPDDATVKQFVAQCLPFRALLIALCAVQYERCFRSHGTRPSLRTGRNDTFMSACLPYCSQFVTNEPRQLECFTEVVSLTRLKVDVRSYQEFRDNFFVMAASTA